MKIVPMLVAGGLLAALAACDAPGMRLREDYVGRAVLEPRLMPELTPRDAQGNPLPPPPPRRQSPPWPVYRGP
jgi:hypothetical protein